MVALRIRRMSVYWLDEVHFFPYMDIASLKTIHFLRKIELVFGTPYQSVASGQSGSGIIVTPHFSDIVTHLLVFETAHVPFVHR